MGINYLFIKNKSDKPFELNTIYMECVGDHEKHDFFCIQLFHYNHLRLKHPKYEQHKTYERSILHFIVSNSDGQGKITHREKISDTNPNIGKERIVSPRIFFLNNTIHIFWFEKYLNKKIVKFKHMGGKNPLKLEKKNVDIYPHPENFNYRLPSLAIDSKSNLHLVSGTGYYFKEPDGSWELINNSITAHQICISPSNIIFITGVTYHRLDPNLYIIDGEEKEKIKNQPANIMIIINNELHLIAYNFVLYGGVQNETRQLTVAVQDTRYNWVNGTFSKKEVIGGFNITKNKYRTNWSYNFLYFNKEEVLLSIITEDISKCHLLHYDDGVWTIIEKKNKAYYQVIDINDGIGKAIYSPCVSKKDLYYKNIEVKVEYLSI